MKRFLCVFLCCLMLLSLLPALAQNVTEVMQVVKCSDYVSLRKEPSTSSERLIKVHLGELVYDCEPATGDFVKCSWEGKTGYILAKYLKTTDYTMNDNIMPNQMVYNCDEYVSLRKSPDSSSERLVKVPKGAIVTGCVSYLGNWVLCEYKGHKGYVLSKYLKKADYTVKPTPTPVPTPTPTPKVYPALPYYMQVVNCNEYVSLRKTASSSSTVLAKVPLGEVVEGCVQVNDKYVSCEYNGQYGYILIQYLAAYEPPKNNTFDDLSFPAYDVFNTRGEKVLEERFNGYTVVVRRGYAGEGEEIMAVCYDPTMKAIWTVADGTDYMTELTLTDALVAGSHDMPLLVMFRSDKGLTAYGIGPWTDELWFNSDAKQISGSISYAVGYDGSIYVIGAYNYSLMCVDKEGQTLWTTDHFDQDVYWPYYVELGEEAIYVYYDSPAPLQNKVYRDTYSYEGVYLNTMLVDPPVIAENSSSAADDAWE